MMMTDQSWLKQGVSGIGDEVGVKKEKGSQTGSPITFPLQSHPL
jgi:hypothetical protein